LEAVDEFKARQHECVILADGDSEISVADIIQELQRSAGSDLELIAYAPEGAAIQDLAQAPVGEHTVLRKISDPDRLLSELTRRLHIPEKTLPERIRHRLERVRQVDQELAGSRVLIVDDDVRNIFALTSILERHKVIVHHAENGKAGIDVLMMNPDIDIVLMDIMMPDMDGYQTIAAIRELDDFRDLPVIAVTAKAMKGDREKCIESGASDYIAKPVDLDQLFSLMRVWLHERRMKTAEAGASV
jgi:CheY-like chemotaxis protein